MSHHSPITYIRPVGENCEVKRTRKEKINNVNSFDSSGSSGHKVSKLDAIIQSNDRNIIKGIAWNIDGIGNKLETEVKDLLAAYDIIFSSETWRKINPTDPKEKSRDQKVVEKLGFYTIEFCRKDSTLDKLGRGHGGLLIAIMQRIFDKLEILENHSNSEIVWIKFKKEFVTLEDETVYSLTDVLNDFLWRMKC